MSNTTYAADDVATIRARLADLEREKAEVRRQNDPETATGANLDRVAEAWGVKRLTPGETDHTFRDRLKRAIGAA